MPSEKATPIYLLPDSEIRKIREWRGRVRDLKLRRSRGYCEICGRPFGLKSSKLDGHHIIRPSDYRGPDPNIETNIVICCDECYRNKVLDPAANKEWANHLYDIPSITADEALDEIKKNPLSNSSSRRRKRQKNSVIYKFHGLSFNIAGYNIFCGFSHRKDMSHNENDYRFIVGYKYKINKNYNHIINTEEV